MKVFYDWLKEIESIGRNVVVSCVADISGKTIEIRVDFFDEQGMRHGCIQIVDIKEEENIVKRDLFIALNKIKLFVKSHSRLISPNK